MTIAACADVLGIPGEPRLADEAVNPDIGEQDAGVQGASNEPAPNTSATDSDTSEQNPSLLLPPAETGMQQPINPPELGDAGAAPDGAEAGTEPGVCGAQRSLGPNGRCFALIAALQSWADARQSCRDLGSGWDLASIRSAAINQFVAGLISGEVWIAASDADQEGRWVWVDDDTAFWNIATDAGALNGEYANWNSTEPNGGNNTNCARIVPGAGNTWADLTCDSTIAAICAGPQP